MIRENRLLGFVLALGLVACHGAATQPALPAAPVPDGLGKTELSLTAFGDRERTASANKGVVGSSNTITAEMPVPRPDTTPCTVHLFQNLQFADFNNKTFSYTPPSTCKAPWSKVVLELDLRVTKGVQFDRTGIMWIDGAVVWFGTTAEPSPQLSPSWHVARDVTDLSALFRKTTQGQISIGNLVNSTYNGVIIGSARLQFYPPDAAYPAPRVPDKVIGMPYAPPLGGSAQLPSQTMAISTPLPHNIVGAKLDLYLQSQHTEEQWFMCVPTNVYTQSKNELGFCPNGPFREGEVAVDNMQAGIAPVYPLERQEVA